MDHVFAQIGASLQQIGGVCPDGWVVMLGERPGAGYVAAPSGEWIRSFKTIFAPREYLKKLTMQEYAAARTHENIGVQWALDNLIGAQFVDINDPDTIAGLDLMVAEGVITPERRTELLTPEAAE